MMGNTKKLHNFFRTNFSLVESSNGWYRFDNPFDHKGGNSMAVNFDYGRVICHRTAYRSSILQFLKIYTGKSKKVLSEVVESFVEIDHAVANSFEVNVSDIVLPEHFYFLDEEVPMQKRALDYMLDRVPDMELLRERSIGFCNDGPWVGQIIFPFMNPQLEYYIGRSFIGSQLKYRNIEKSVCGKGKSELFYNETALLGEKVYLCEGVFDALTCGTDGIAALGWSLSKIQRSKLIESGCDVYIVPDAGFYEKARILGLSLIDHQNVYIANLDNMGDKDINDIGNVDLLDFKKLNWI